MTAQPETNIIQQHDTELDKELQEIALNNWGAFVRLVGEGSIVSAKVCILKSKGKSYAQIAIRFKKSKSWSQYINNSVCRPCD